jgi:hypothetical protein
VQGNKAGGRAMDTKKRKKFKTEEGGIDVVRKRQLLYNDTCRKG